MHNNTKEKKEAKLSQELRLENIPEAHERKKEPLASFFWRKEGGKEGGREGERMRKREKERENERGDVSE